MKIKNLLLLFAAAAMSATAVAQDLKTGEYAFQGDGVTPAVIGQPTADHFFTRNIYSDTGSEKSYDNTISFQANTPQVVEFWLDDDQIYTNAAIQDLTPVPCYDGEADLYTEITYNSAQFDIYLPMQFTIIKYKFEGEKRAVDFQAGERMPWDANLQWSEKAETKTIDGIEYRGYTVIINNNKNDACHFSGNEEEYAEHGALKKNDAPLFRLAINNANQEEVEDHLADMIIANQEFGIREAVRDGWAPNDYRFFYGTGGNNVVQRFQYYHRVAMYGSTAVVENLAEKTINNVKYFNIAGMESDMPFDGVNIKVTTYNDGTTSTCKVIK